MSGELNVTSPSCAKRYAPGHRSEKRYSITTSDSVKRGGHTRRA